MSKGFVILTEYGWEPAEPIKFAYPRWIEAIPFRWLRQKVKRWWFWGGVEDE